jgi:hypothetical protein
MAVGQRHRSVGVLCGDGTYAQDHVRSRRQRYGYSDLGTRQKPRALGALFLLAARSQIFAMEQRPDFSRPGRASPGFSFHSAIIKNFDFPAASGSSAVDLIESSSADQDRVQDEQCRQSAYDSDNHAE